MEPELLEANDDDYLETSVDANRLVARVKAVLRRSLLLDVSARPPTGIGSVKGALPVSVPRCNRRAHPYYMSPTGGLRTRSGGTPSPPPFPRERASTMRRPLL